jgi:hypothetical protein
MAELRDLFEGLGEPESPESEVDSLPTESLDSWTRRREVEHRIKQESLKEKHKRHVANAFLGGTLVVLCGFVIAGIVTGREFDAADKWWAFIGPLVGYLLRVLFEARDQGKQEEKISEKAETTV